MEAFLDNSGQQLVDLLRGRGGTRPTQEIPLHQLEAVVSLFYSTINDVYIGFDSHPPSRFLAVHPFLLDNLAASESEENGSQATPDKHEECHSPRWVRIVPFTAKALQNDFNEHPDVASRYFTQHKERHVTLLRVDPQVQAETHDEVLQGEWTGDLGLWVNTCALLFEPSIKKSNDRLRLELVYPHNSRFGKYLRYVGRLIEAADRVWLQGKEIRTEPLSKHLKDHLIWDLKMMFEPRLADAWDEFVSPAKRVNKLGPFIEDLIAGLGRKSAVVLDAATGIGCDSLYLASKGHEVVSNEIDPRLIAHSVELAEQTEREPLDIKRFDWRHFEHLAEPETFDIVLALGNSLSCLSSEREVLAVLSRFAHLLKPKGLLIVDERNYPAMFDQRSQMADRDFRFPSKVIYCSKTIQARPRSMPEKPGVDNDILTLEYIRANENSAVGTFDVLPFADGQLKRLLEDSGFRSVKEYFNLRASTKDRADAQFVTYVASRTYDVSELVSGRIIEAVIAFTDISESTAAKKRLGEKTYAEEWQAHERLVKRVIKKHGGRLVNDTGDGFLLEFKDPDLAVKCLKSIVENPGTTQLIVRAGVTLGKATRNRAGNLRGHDVDVAARICDSARPDLVVADDRVMLKVHDFEWTQQVGVQLKGAGERDLWTLIR